MLSSEDGELGDRGLRILKDILTRARADGGEDLKPYKASECCREGEDLLRAEDADTALLDGSEIEAVEACGNAVFRNKGGEEEALHCMLGFYLVTDEGFG